VTNSGRQSDSGQFVQATDEAVLICGVRRRARRALRPKIVPLGPPDDRCGIVAGGEPGLRALPCVEIDMGARSAQSHFFRESQKSFTYWQSIRLTRAILFK